MPSSSSLVTVINLVPAEINKLLPFVNATCFALVGFAFMYSELEG